MLVAPSILSADFNNLLEEVKTVESAKYLHIDVMDGHFVPNISMGPCIIKNLKNKINMIFDVHLMISDPFKYILDYVKIGADIITFHYESYDDQEMILKTIKKIKDNNVKVGMSIKPNTNPDVLLPFLKYLDLVLVMSVEPGFGGQKFMDNSLEKLKYLSEIRNNNKYNYLLEVDGGINFDSSKLVKDNGCDICVVGSFLFNSTNRQEVIEKIENSK